MTRLMLIILLGTATIARAYFESTNAIAAKAGVHWGNDELFGDDIVSDTNAHYTAGYTNEPHFSGAATASATYDAAAISVLFSTPGGTINYTQHVAFAHATYLDTFVVSGPIGTGHVEYIFNSDFVSTETIGDSDNLELYTSRILKHNGIEMDVKPITFGLPFTFEFDLYGSIAIYGTNENSLVSASIVASNIFERLEVFDENYQPISNGFTIVSSSGAIYPKGPRIFVEELGSNIIATWHSISDAVYSVATSSSLTDDLWNTVATNIVGTGSINALVIERSSNDFKLIRLETE